MNFWHGSAKHWVSDCRRQCLKLTKSKNQQTQFPSALSPDGRLLCLATERRSLACYRLLGPTTNTSKSSSSRRSRSSSAASEEAFVLDFDEQEVEGVTPPVPVAITCLQVRPSVGAH